MDRERMASTYDIGRLLSVVEGLSPRKVRMVTPYAENLRERPVSDTGSSYIAMLLRVLSSSGFWNGARGDNFAGYSRLTVKPAWPSGCGGTGFVCCPGARLPCGGWR